VAGQRADLLEEDNLVAKTVQSSAYRPEIINTAGGYGSTLYSRYSSEHTLEIFEK
jgi:hypothetical protein